MVGHKLPATKSGDSEQCKRLSYTFCDTPNECQPCYVVGESDDADEEPLLDFSGNKLSSESGKESVTGDDEVVKEADEAKRKVRELQREVCMLKEKLQHTTKENTRLNEQLGNQLAEEFLVKAKV